MRGKICNVCNIVNSNLVKVVVVCVYVVFKLSLSNNISIINYFFIYTKFINNLVKWNCMTFIRRNLKKVKNLYIILKAVNNNKLYIQFENEYNT